MKSNAGMKILLSIFAVLSFQVTMFSQTTDDLLNTPVKLNMSETCLFVAIVKLAFEFRIPVGFELPSDYREKEAQKMFYDGNNRLRFDDRPVVKEGTLKE